jgi:glucose dehydrogenase
MPNFPTVLFNAVNILLCLGMLVYSVRWYHLFRGAKMQKGISFFVVSILFFLFAALARAALVWTIFSADLDYVDISIRTVAFVFLFLALMRTVQAWTNSARNPSSRLCLAS